MTDGISAFGEKNYQLTKVMRSQALA